MNRFVAVVVVVGCSSPPDVLEARKIPEALQPDVASVVASNNQFTCDIYQQLAPNSSNMVFSAFSMSTAFAMLDAGARTVSDTEIRSAFHWTLDGDRLHAAYGALLTSLDTGRDYNTYTLATADRLFGQDGFPFQDDYLAITKDDYQAELLPVDFANDTSGAIQTIDQWVSDQTDAKIPQLFGPGDLAPSTVLALVNAILFKGNWEKHFDHDRTADGPFHKADGTTVTASLMAKSDSLALGPIPGGQLAVLPFDGKDLEMVILLPSAVDGLPTLEAQLTGDALTGWITGATAGGDQDIILPKFALDSSFDLPQALIALGITTVWDPTMADLSGIDGSHDLYVNKAVHKAMITVDEDGAEAAAATGIGVGDGAAPEPFRADHPFIFAIFDNVTNSVLFMGRVEDPST
jgi:serpin B